jgi:ABC-2 type transport system permease protein
VNARLGIVGAIVSKDLREFARDRFYVLVSVLGLVVYVVVFWVLPSTVDETLRLGIHLDGAGPLVAGVAGSAEGLEVLPFGSGEALEDAVAAGDTVVAGLDFPDGFVRQVAAGERVTVRVLVPGDAPAEFQPVLEAVVREVAFTLAGEPPPVTPPTLEDVVVGTDRAGQQVPLREKMRPLFVFFVLLVEMFALATLVAAEIHQRTITALLVTPARVADVLAAKVLLGTLLAFSQGMLILIATGSLLRAPLLLSLAVLLGAVLVSGIALIAGSTGRDFVGIVFWSVLFMFPLAVPAISVLFPGTTAGWIRALPTYGLVEVLVGVASYGEGWTDVLPDLVALLAWCVFALGLGVVILGRRVARV